jgi:hypothetical protein
LWSVAAIFVQLQGMHSRQQDKTGRVKVYRFRLYDAASENFKISARMATPACIRRIRGEIIKRTELEIDKQYVNSDGMTEAGFLERAVINSAVAGDASAPWLTANSARNLAFTRADYRPRAVPHGDDFAPASDKR